MHNKFRRFFFPLLLENSNFLRFLMKNLLFLYSVRGILGSLTVLSSAMGILLVFVAAGYCEYFTIPKFAIMLAALYGVLFVTFPETPLVLMKQNKIEVNVSLLPVPFQFKSINQFFLYTFQEAENSIKFYQNLGDDKKQYETVQMEMKKLSGTIDASNKCDGKSMSWSDCVKNPGRKALTIGVGLSIVNQFCGIPALIAYTTNIFEEAGSNISPDSATIVVGLIQVFGTFVTTNLVDRAGRKVKIQT